MVLRVHDSVLSVDFCHIGVSVEARSVKTIDDAKLVLEELQNWKKMMQTKPWNLHGLRITNGGPAQNPNDFVILSQLPQIPQPQEQSAQFYTIVFNSTGPVTAGTTISAPFVIGRGREGQPWEMHVAAITAPSTIPLQVNMQQNRPVSGQSDIVTTLLSTPLTLPIGNKGPVISSQFIAPTPNFALYDKITPIVVACDGIVSMVTISLIIKRVISP